jgi:hypothetical protein
MGIAMVAILMIGMFVFLFVILPAAPPSAFVQGPETGLAVSLANEIKPLPVLEDSTCQGIPVMASNVITVLQDMDRTIGTGFGAVQFDASQGCDVIVQYAPVLGTYDNLILASRALDPNNATSVKRFYVDAFLLSSDFIIINDAVSYKLAFKTTGELNNDLSLATLRSICGDDCYSAVLSGIHWTIRLYMNQFLCAFEGWLSSLKVPYLNPEC